MSDDWRLLMSQGRFEKASRILEQATQQDPSNINLHLSLANCYYALRQCDLAYKECQIVLQLSPRNADALFLESQFIPYPLSLRKFDLVEETIRLEPKNPAYLKELGMLYYNFKNYKKAKKYLIAAQTIHPQNDSYFYFMLGNVDSSLSLFSDAKEAYQTALSLEPPKDLRSNILEACSLLSQRR